MSGQLERAGLARPRGEGSGRAVADASNGSGYYDHPLLKPPVWTWQIPLYFFVGGLSGGSAIIAVAVGLVRFVAPTSAIATSHAWLGLDLMTLALLLAVAGLVCSVLLLVWDLGRPRRFYNMLRVFKWQSPMSVGVWLLAVYSPFVSLALVCSWLDWQPAALAFASGAGLFGSLVCTYTGVLIAVSVVPAWASHRTLLPFHFGAVALGSSAAALVLLGHHPATLLVLLAIAAAAELVVAALLELRQNGATDEALRHGTSGHLIRATGTLTGPTTLALVLLRFHALAAALFLLGGVGSRYAWLLAGKRSATNPQAVLELAERRRSKTAR